jgi:hypothetical protein
MKRGISSAKNLVPFVSCLADSGIRFAFRYYSQSSWKRLTLAEAGTLTDAGIEIGAVYEDAPLKVSYFTSARGHADTQRAIGFAQAMGQPSGTAIYFAVDYDATLSDLPAISAYFTAVRSQLDAAGYQVGIYAGGTVCQTIKENQGLAAFSWLAESTGFLGSHTYTTWDIKQSVAHVPLCGLAGPHNGEEADYEDNQAQDNFGGFTLQPAAPQIAAMAFAEAAPRTAPAKAAKKKQPAAKAKNKAVTTKKAAPAKKTKVAKKSTTGARKSAKKSAPKKSVKKTPAKKKATKAKALKKQSTRKRR